MSMQVSRTAHNHQGIGDAPPVGIVADDLTGATDSAVQFARDGWAARLALTAPSAGSTVAGSVTAVVTDARPMHSSDARAATTAAVQGLVSAGTKRLFVKIDSTMRGSVAHQIAGALDAWADVYPDAVAVVCSAYPAMGRTIEHGHVLVNGEDVQHTAIGTDPVTPVTTSDLRELLPGSTHVSLGDAASADAAALVTALDHAITSGTRVITVDASTDADLARLATALEQLGDRAIPVGAAGLAVAMSHVWAVPNTLQRSHTGARRAVVVVSSLHDVSRAQSDYLRTHVHTDRLCVLAPSLGDALTPAAMNSWADQALKTIASLPEIVIIVSPTDRPDARGELFSTPADTSSDEGNTPAAELIADSLATITYRVLEHSPVDALMLLGGEGARAVLSRLGATALRVHDAIREGIPLGTVEGGTAHGLTVVTKAGGFGAPSTVHDIVTELISPAPVAHARHAAATTPEGTAS